MSGPLAVEMLQIDKAFPGVTANTAVDFAARWGEVHALLGENGAGKTTLMSILAGLYRPDAGQIRIDGVSRRIIGVMPADFHVKSWFPASSDGWIPLAWTEKDRQTRGNDNYMVVARLRDGVDDALVVGGDGDLVHTLGARGSLSDAHDHGRDQPTDDDGPRRSLRRRLGGLAARRRRAVRARRGERLRRSGRPKAPNPGKSRRL